MLRILPAAVIALLVVADVGYADLIYFEKGGQAQLPVKVDGETVVVETPDGPKSFPRSDFLAIVAAPSPAEEWPGRQAEAKRVGTVEARFAAAWWALENGLTSEALTAFEELRPLAWNHTPTRRALAAIDLMSLPCPDPDVEPIRSKLRPLKFRETRSPHVVLLHQGTEAEAKERLDLLERVAQTFLISFAAQGIELPALNHKLVSIYFAERRDYVHFLRTVQAGAFADTQGYFHPTLRAVFAFDTRSGEEQKTGHRAIANRKRDGASSSDLARQTLLLDLEWRTTDFGIAAHETIHLLTAETGLSPHLDDFPYWLHEGLAAQFEVVRGGRWAGFGRVHDLRLPDWRTIRPIPKLIPLVKDSGFGHGYRRDLYAESWALVYYLRKSHPVEFVAFLDQLRTPGSSSRPDRTLEAFRAAFGKDFGKLEAAWRTYLSELKTPLESGRPPLPDRASRSISTDSKRQLVAEEPGH